MNIKAMMTHDDFTSEVNGVINTISDELITVDDKIQKCGSESGLELHLNGVKIGLLFALQTFAQYPKRPEPTFEDHSTIEVNHE